MSEKLKESVRDARLREAERLLSQERLGLDAVATAFLQESHDPVQLMHRLDRMAEAAVERDLSARARDAIIFGQQLFRRRLERHLLKQQELLPRDEAEQLQDPPNQGSLIEPVDLHGALASADKEMRERVIALFRSLGGLSDRGLSENYNRTYGGAVPHERLQQVRKALTRQGLLFNRAGSDWIWDLRERDATND